MKIDLPSVTVSGVTIQHNNKPWRVAKNAHPTTWGRSWGWIEGAPGNVCWSDEKSFGQASANQAVKIHNDWLEEQKPPMLKMIEAVERQNKALKRFEHAEKSFREAEEELKAIDREVIQLSILIAKDVNL